MHTVEVNPLKSQECVSYTEKASLVLEILRKKWTLQILCVMRVAPVRLSSLSRLIPVASKKGLRASLRDLESRKIVVRRDLSERVLHVEYDFAEGMKPVVYSLLDSLIEWGSLLDDRTDLPSKDSN